MITEQNERKVEKMKKMFSIWKDTFNKCGGGSVGCLGVIICLVLTGGICFGIFCLEGWLLMLLWNWLAVELFSAPVLGYWVCVGIMFAIWFIRQIVFGKKVVKVEINDD
jgi:hypothetical protein